MIPLVVTAETPAGFSSSDPWSPSLDGLIAYWLLREQLGEEEFALGMTGQRPLVTPEDLPLERVDDGAQWWWSCSIPEYTNHAEYPRYYHRRFDTLAAERFADTGKSGRVAVTSGPYKNYRNALTVHVCPRVVWHCVGDPDEIRRLLRRCSYLGAKGGQGVGRVMRWTVTEDGADKQLARFRRPLPVGYATSQAIGGPLLTWGIRPPGRLQENQCLCVMPQ